MIVVTWSLVLVASCVVLASDFNECRNLFNRPIGTPPLQVDLDGCETSPCSVTRGSQVSGAMTFVAGRDLTRLKPEVTAFVRGFLFSFPVNGTDACTSLTTKSCPIKAGEEATYEYTMTIPRRIPTANLVLRHALRDQRGLVSVCAEITLKIGAAESKIIETNLNYN